MARPRHKHTTSGNSLLLYGQEYAVNSSTDISTTSVNRMSHHDIASVSPAFLDSRYPSPRRQSTIDEDANRRLSTFSPFDGDGTRRFSTLSMPDASKTRRQSTMLDGRQESPSIVKDSRPSLSPLVIPADSSSSGSKISNAQEVEVVLTDNNSGKDGGPESADSVYSQKSASVYAASRAPTIRVAPVEDSNSPVIEVMRVDFENRLDFRQPVVDRSNTRVIGHLLQSRARRNSTDLSRNFSQVSHIERAGSIKPIEDGATDILRRARNRLIAQKQGNISNVTKVGSVTEVLKTPVSVISPTNTPFTTISLTPATEKTTGHKR